MKVQEYDGEEPSQKHLEYRCSIPPSTFDSFVKQNSFSASVASWVSTAKECFITGPDEQYGKDAIDRQQTVKSLKHLTALIESGKHDCSEIATMFDALNSLTTFHFTVKAKK